MKVVLVCEAWGKSEAQFQHPLVGASGRELSLQLGISTLAPFMTILCRKCKRESQFIDPWCEFCHEYLWPNEFNLIDHWKRLREVHKIHVTNVFNCRPDNNNVGLFFSKEKEVDDLPPCRIPKNINGSYIRRDQFHHVKRLWAELTDLKPNLVIAMGNVPSWALLGQTNIMSIRGTINWSDRLNLKVLPTVHPSGVMHNWPIRPTVIADLKKAATEAQFPEIRRPFRWITIPAPNSDGIDEIKHWLEGARKTLRNDIETVRRQISIIGFSDSPDRALVIPFRDCHSENGKIVDVGKIANDIGFPNNGINFWPSADLEFKAWKLAIDTIESRKIELTFQNGIYDMSYYIKMGIHPYRAEHDTMLWHHSMYPEQQKSLGYLGSIYANDISWKNMRKSSDSLKRDE